MLTRRSSILIIITLVVGSATLSSSCARTDPTTSDAPSPNVYAIGICNHYARCTPAIVRTQFGSTEACTSAIAAEATKRFAAPGVGITRRSLNACILESESAPCDVEIDSLASCDFRGSLAEGAPCGSGIQCVTGACAKDSNADCGSCAPPIAQTPPSNVDEPCDPARRCNPTLACYGAKCVVPLGVDEACTIAGIPCDAARGLVCDGGFCRAILVPQGGFCDTIPFCEASYCSVEKTCVMRAAEGETCGTNVECTFPLDCRNGVCVASDPASCR